MHESLLAKDTVSLILEESEKLGASKILNVKIKVYDIEKISEESFLFYMKNYSQGSILEQANIEIDILQVPILCTSCGVQYYSDVHVGICEKCGSLGVKPALAEGIFVEYIDIE